MQPQDIVSKMATKENFIFSFDFGMFCVNLALGGPQAAYPSVKGVAASTPPAIKWSTKCRAGQNCTVSTPMIAPRWDLAPRKMGSRLQARPHVTRTRNGRAQGRSFGIGRAQVVNTPAPALFHAPLFHAQLNAPALCDSSPSAGQAARQIRGQIC